MRVRFVRFFAATQVFLLLASLIAGLADSVGQALLDGAARRMRALTGYDRVSLSCGERHAESSRGTFGGAVDPANLPILVSDTDGQAISLFPRQDGDTSAHAALLRAPQQPDRRELNNQGIRAMLRIPFDAAG